MVGTSRFRVEHDFSSLDARLVVTRAEAESVADARVELAVFEGNGVARRVGSLPFFTGLGDEDLAVQRLSRSMPARCGKHERNGATKEEQASRQSLK